MKLPIHEKVFKAAIVDLNTGEVKQFQHNPDQWTDERFVEYATNTIPGISMPRYQFVAGGETIIRFRLWVNALNHKNGGSGILNEFMWYRKKTYPIRSYNILKVAPPKVLFIWPGMYSSKCIISSCNAEWTDFFPDGKPKHGYINMELKKSID